jgi:hypothetical protein
MLALDGDGVEHSCDAVEVADFGSDDDDGDDDGDAADIVDGDAADIVDGDAADVVDTV